MKTTKPSKLLLIEDDSDQWLLTKTAFRQAWPEASLVHAATAQQALDLLENWLVEEWELPKLILMDLYLPTAEDGWSLLKQIKAMPVAVSRLPVTILSVSNEEGDVRQAYQLGVSSYVVKPADFPQWLDLIGSFRDYWTKTVTLPPLSYSS